MSECGCPAREGKQAQEKKEEKTSELIVSFNTQIDLCRGGQLRNISEVSEAGVKTIRQFHYLGPFTHPLSSSPSADHSEVGVKTIRQFHYSGPFTHPLSSSP